MSNTPNMGLPMPDPEANVDDEFYRLQTAMLLLDVILTTFAESIAGKSPQGHTHPISGVNGLAAALASKMNADKKFSLVDLVDVLGASDAAAGYLLQKTVNGFGFTSVAAALGNHRHTTADIDGLVTLIQQYISALVDSSPATLDTLKELATALGNDPNFATTMAAALAKKVNDTGDTMSGQLAIYPPDNAYGLWLERKNSVSQGVLARLRTTDVAGGVKFGPKLNFLKDGGESWNIGLRNGTDGGIAFSAGANEGQAGGERFIVTPSGSIILYDGSNITTILPNGDILFGGAMAALFGVNLSTALSNKVSVNYTTSENETVFPLGTTIPVAGSFGTGTPRNYLQAIYHSSNYAYATTSVNGASQLAGTWRMIGTISSSIALFRRVG